MKFAVITAAIAMLLHVFSLSFLFQPKIRTLYPSHIKQVVHLHLDTGGRCTGFIIKPGVIVTASHCAEDGVKTYVADFYDNSHSIFTVKAHGNSNNGDDWALATGDTRGIPPLNFPSAPPELPYVTFNCGYGLGSVQMLIPSIVMRVEKGPHPILDLFADVEHGDSGGPVLGRGGQVLGIVVAMGMHEHVGFAVPYQVIQKALKDNGL